MPAENTKKAFTEPSTWQFDRKGKTRRFPHDFIHSMLTYVESWFPDSQPRTQIKFPYRSSEHVDGIVVFVVASVQHHFAVMGVPNLARFVNPSTCGQCGRGFFARPVHNFGCGSS